MAARSGAAVRVSSGMRVRGGKKTPPLRHININNNATITTGQSLLCSDQERVQRFPYGSGGAGAGALRIGGSGGGSGARNVVVAGSRAVSGGSSHFLGAGQIALRHRRDPAYAAVVKQRYRRLLHARLPPPKSGREHAGAAAAFSDFEKDEGDAPVVDADFVSEGGYDDEATVDIPISFYTILNLSPARSAPAAIEAAYSAVMQRELVEGFSELCIAARADLVDAAAQVISDGLLKTEHESDLKNGRLTPVPASQLGGALALMQEAGEHEAVIEYAPQCLAAVKGRAARRDITLSAALAHCELSHIALTSTPPRVGEGCELLDIASSILVAEAGANFSRELQDTINRTLEEMAPAYVIELLALPLERAEERKEGIRALRSVMWAEGEAALADRSAYVQEVNRHLTSAEAVDLFVEAPDHVLADTDEVYQSALAHIVTGFRDRRPMLLVDADQMLAQLEASGDEAESESVGVERAVCQLLIGRVDDAAATLGLGPNQYQTGVTVDPQVEQFVADNSPTGDVTEGLCALADRWLADVAFPSFRDSARVSPVPTVIGWFDEPRVQRFCTRYEAAPAMLKVQALIEAAGRATTSMVDAATVAVRGSSVPGLRAGVAGAGGGGGGVGGIVGSSAGNLVNYVRNKDNTVNVALGGAVGVGAVLIASGLVSGRGLALPFASPSTSSAAATSPKPAGGVRELSVLVGAAASNVGDSISGAVSHLPGFNRPAPPVDAAVAEQIVRRWQNAKAQALGVAHNLRPLEQVLEGPMLQQWLTRAEDVRAHGWAWEYQLNALSVDNIEVMTPSRVMVEATLTEVAILKDRARTEEDDKYESTYRARYELRRTEDGGGVRAWKIVGGSVVY